jgi:hypothetical protein
MGNDKDRDTASTRKKPADRHIEIERENATVYDMHAISTAPFAIMRQDHAA